MNRITCILADGAVASAASCVNKPAIFAKLANMAAENYGLNADAILDGLDERERLGSTGFGGGTAIPHCKINEIFKPVGVFLRLDKAMDYGSVDERPVDLIFALISPTQDGAAHLRALAEVSRMFRDEKSCKQLRGAADHDALFALLAHSDERDAA
jgi:nitrogen PTS system EIIA component